MKLFVLVAAAAMALASCQKNEIENPVEENKEYVYTFLIGNADASDEVNSKATIGQNNVEWENGDKIGSFTKSDNAYSNVTVTDGLASFSVCSKGGLSVDDVLYFYYPYDSNAGTDKTAVSMSIPTDQDGVDEMPMASLPFVVTTASSENQTIYAGEVKLANLGSVIEFNVYTETADYASEIVKSVSFEADQALAGTFTFDLTAVNYSEPSTLNIKSELSEKTIEVSAGNATVGTKEAPVVIRMVVAPGSYTGNIVVKTNAATYTFPISSAKEFPRSAVKPLGLKLRADVREENAPDVWTLVTSVDNMPDGEYVILAKHTEASGYGYLPSTTTSSSPVYTQQTIFDAVTSVVSPTSVEEAMIWNLSKTSDKWTITNAVGDCFYCTNSNNGLRVGTTEDTWTITTNQYNSSALTMKSTTNSRFVGVYNNADWRSYTTANAQNYGKEENGFQNAQLFFYYHGTITAKPAVSATDINVSARGVENAELAYTLVNPDGSSVSVECDGTIVTDVENIDGVISYTVAANTTTDAREGTITITYGEVEKVVKVSQLAPLFTSTKTEIVLESEAEVSSSFTITSDFDWTAILSENAGFTVSPDSYEWAEGGKQSVTVTATAANVSEDGTITLGTITFTNASTEQTIEVIVKQESSYVDESDVVATGTLTSGKTNVVLEDGKAITYSEIKVGSNYAEYTNPARFYASNKVTVTTSDGVIKEIEITCTTSAYATVLKNSVTNIGDVSVNGSVVTLTLTTPVATVEWTNSAQWRATTMTVTYSVNDSGNGDETPALTERNLAFSATTATATVDQDFTEPTLSGETTGVTYSSSNTAVATVNESTGEVTLVAAGETTITATAAEDATYAADEASYTLTVSAAQGGGDEGEKVWTLVTDASTLQAGDIIRLGCSAKGTAAGAMGTGKYFTSVTATYSNDTMTSDSAIDITLGGQSGAWTLTTSEGLIGTSAARALKLNSGTDTWTIEIVSGDATIKSTNTSYGWIQYNASSPRFLNYASNQTAIQIYRYN